MITSLSLCFHKTPFPYISLLHFLILLLLNTSMYFSDKMQRFNMAFSDYNQALEKERPKIQVFSKELPLSLELVTQAIETCKQQLSGTTSEYNLNGQLEHTTSTGPVLEEFIPTNKERASSPCFDEDDEQHSNKTRVQRRTARVRARRTAQLPPSMRRNCAVSMLQWRAISRLVAC
ncbi:transcription factor HHO2-like [Cajanus cajan]|uniref:transcription factor HHO2-like n=1 Tax=Cajanus cajan TaxID=3821 RepID=UPI00098DB749|nr:transcription factor HHO2-like [Cajanus cajan]